MLGLMGGFMAVLLSITLIFSGGDADRREKRLYLPDSRSGSASAAPETQSPTAPESQSEADSVLPQGTGTLTIDLEDCNVVLALTEGDEVLLEDDNGLVEMAITENGEKRIITMYEKKGSNSKQQPVQKPIRVLIPEAWVNGRVMIRAEDAGVRVCAMNADLDINGDDSAFSCTVPKGFTKSIRFYGEGSACSMMLADGADDFTLMIQAEDSSVSIPKDFPWENLNPNTQPKSYSYVAGSGVATVDIRVKECAFSLNIET